MGLGLRLRVYRVCIYDYGLKLGGGQIEGCTGGLGGPYFSPCLI